MKERMLPLFKCFGKKFRAHNSGCAQSFREDKRAGLIYSAYRHPETMQLIDVWQSSREFNFCAYCGYRE